MHNIRVLRHMEPSTQISKESLGAQAMYEKFKIPIGSLRDGNV
jgi:hypothetical protein